MIASLYQSTSRFSGKPLPPGPIAVPPCKAGQRASLYKVTTAEPYSAPNAGSVIEIVVALQTQTGYCMQHPHMLRLPTRRDWTPFQMAHLHNPCLLYTSDAAD